ncbi:MAG TPA: hypothetical protein VER17_03680 [Tepidisphaeraceae bacterium]|nr:hypothetical protein [Tepidisphaeraceae bacterium]
MADVAIFNASPLIALANARHPEVARAAADELIVPAAVLEELSRRGEADPAVQLARSGWFQIVRPIDVPPGDRAAGTRRRRIRSVGAGRNAS